MPLPAFPPVENAPATVASPQFVTAEDENGKLMVFTTSLGKGLWVYRANKLGIQGGAIDFLAALGFSAEPRTLQVQALDLCQLSDRTIYLAFCASVPASNLPLGILIMSPFHPEDILFETSTVSLSALRGRISRSIISAFTALGHVYVVSHLEYCQKEMKPILESFDSRHLLTQAMWAMQ